MTNLFWNNEVSDKITIRTSNTIKKVLEICKNK